MEYTIAQADMSDIEAVHKYLNVIFALKLDTIFLRPNGMSLEEVTTWIEDSVNSKNKVFLIAKTQNEVVGNLKFACYPRLENQHRGEFGMSIHPDHRRKGLGRRLIEELETWAQGNGILKIELKVWSNNAIALNLYNKLGYQVEGVRKAAIIRDGHVRDAILMGKWIGQPVI